jgi:hypothetical protein
VSRLDSFIRRLEAQRRCLALAAGRSAGIAGSILELGLGNGRTFDHLREICAGREIFVFDRLVAAHPDCVPDASHLFLGDFRETLGTALARLGAGCAAFIHADLGSGDAGASRDLAATIAPSVALLLAPGGILVSDQPMPDSGLLPVALPEGVDEGRYFIAKKRASSGRPRATTATA